LNGQTYAGKKLKRSLSSIFTVGNVHLDLYHDIQKFIENKSTYNKLNYPYNYCALLYGVPGSGKSSTILAIASELNRNIVYINLATASTTTLLRQMNDDPDHSIFVFEDIDAITTKSVGNRNNEKKKEAEDCRSEDDIFTRALSLSDMLNITDGLLASDGAISIFTTNHIEKLDPAFLRAGRMNKLIKYTYMNPETAKAMVDAYLDVGDIKLKDNIKPPELQEMILSILVGNKTVQDLKNVFEEK
jgi:chaperone BCS1